MGVMVRDRRGAYHYLTVGFLALLFAGCSSGPKYRPVEVPSTADAAYNRGDYETAHSLYKREAEQGKAEAQYTLGVMYYTGRGVPQDYAEAAKWYRKAAEQGYAAAQYNLGFMYYTGQGVQRDSIPAHMWFNLAASRYPVSEIKNRNDAIVYRDRVASLMTPAQIAEAQRLATEWKPKTEAR